MGRLVWLAAAAVFVLATVMVGCWLVYLPLWWVAPAFDSRGTPHTWADVLVSVVLPPAVLAAALWWSGRRLFS